MSVTISLSDEEIDVIKSLNSENDVWNFNKWLLLIVMIGMLIGSMALMIGAIIFEQYGDFFEGFIIMMFWILGTIALRKNWKDNKRSRLIDMIYEKYKESAKKGDVPGPATHADSASPPSIPPAR
ncbi:hypothetical protein LBMAG53_27510 [Planctomycetota bacterium]|nr:hypothetical protein LBMAG53_27510 [Planctomycetota bacterium]